MKGPRADKPSSEAHRFVHFICAQARIEGISEREMCRRAGYQLKTLTRLKKGTGSFDVRLAESFLQVFDLGLKITRKEDSKYSTSLPLGNGDGG